MPSRDPTPEVNCKYGAPMGRAGERSEHNILEEGKFYLMRVPLNSGGYDKGGAYWGIGAPLYYFEGPSGVSGYVRGRMRSMAKAEVLKRCPNATFYR